MARVSLLALKLKTPRAQVKVAPLAQGLGNLGDDQTEIRININKEKGREEIISFKGWAGWTGRWIQLTMTQWKTI